MTSPIFGGMFGGGEADFDSNDINTANKRGGQQRASVHEAGHMFGLDDEYGDADEDVDHSDIVEDEGGGKVVRGRGRPRHVRRRAGRQRRTARRSSRSCRR